MKKRKGFLRFKFGDETVDIPIDDKHRAIPFVSYWEGSNDVTVHKRKVDYKNELDWYRIQDELDHLAEQKANESRSKGGVNRAKKLTEDRQLYEDFVIQYAENLKAGDWIFTTKRAVIIKEVKRAALGSASGRLKKLVDKNSNSWYLKRITSIRKRLINPHS